MSRLMFFCIFTLHLWILIDLRDPHPNKDVITANVFLSMLCVLGVYFHWV